MVRQPAPPFPEQPLSPPGLESKMSPAPQYAADGYRPAGKLEGRVALITGGDSGIGRAVAVLFAREGADVALVFLEEERTDAEETRQAVESEGREALLLPGDVRNPDFCQDAVDATVGRFGRIDILVNNAAMQQHCDSLEELVPEQWENTFAVSIFGYYYMARAALKHLRSGGTIINTGSSTGFDGSSRLLDYASTKGAIHAFTKSLAKNVLERGVRVNCVAPGPVWTPLNPAERPHDEMESFGSQAPIGRPAQPDEIAPAYVFLASDADSSYITGHVMPVLGGGTIGA